jgi:hypothetical protein
MQSTTIKVRNSRSISDFISPPWRSVATSLTILLARGQSRSLIPTRILGRYLQNCGQFLVRSEGLEPPRCYSLPPQGSASTNSATSAWEIGAELAPDPIKTGSTAPM